MTASSKHTLLIWWAQILFAGAVIWWAAATSKSLEQVQASAQDIRAGQESLVQSLEEFRVTVAELKTKSDSNYAALKGDGVLRTMLEEQELRSVEKRLLAVESELKEHRIESRRTHE